MSIINDSQKVLLTLKPVTVSGKPSALAGAPSWSISDPNVATLEVAGDSMSAYLVSANPGSAQVTVVGNANLSGGLREITGLLDLTVTVTEANELIIEVGTPEDK